RRSQYSIEAIESLQLQSIRRSTPRHGRRVKYSWIYRDRVTCRRIASVAVIYIQGPGSWHRPIVQRSVHLNIGSIPEITAVGVPKPNIAETWANQLDNILRCHRKASSKYLDDVIGMDCGAVVLIQHAVHDRCRPDCYGYVRRLGDIPDIGSSNSNGLGACSLERRYVGV